jgi:hypothetical protein
MTSFSYHKHKNKIKLESLHDNILELKVHFESKLILTQRLDEEYWINQCI